MNGDDASGRVFGSVADDYDRWRPGYPGEVVEWVAGRVEGRRAAEIGAGTGKATRSFVEAGFEVVAVEPDRQMVAVGRRRVPGASWVEVTAEEWEGGMGAFDLVYGAQSWHWLPPALDGRLAAAVRPGGALALLWNRPDHERRQEHFDDLYRRYMPHAGESRRRTLHRRDDRHWVDRLAAVSAEVETFEHAWSTVMTTRRYLGLTGTYSDHLALGEERRRALEDAIARRIESMGGSLRVDYVTKVFLGRVLPT